MTDFTFPTDTAMLAAFESILDQLDTERRQADPKDRKEQTYWRGQHNAFAKAFRYYRDGVRPDWTGESYLITSATRPIVHRVRLVGGIWLCSCEATAFCWHAATIAAIEKALGLIEQGLVGDAGDGTPGPIVVTTTPSGLTLSRGDVALDCHAPAEVAQAIDALTRGAQLGQRLALARHARQAA